MDKVKWECVEMLVAAQGRVRSIFNEKGQGTTEYAILVGVLAVIAMLAIAAFKDKVSSLWEAITNGVNGL